MTLLESKQKPQGNASSPDQSTGHSPQEGVIEVEKIKKIAAILLIAAIILVLTSNVLH